jgi:hypothetical protein
MGALETALGFFVVTLAGVALLHAIMARLECVARACRARRLGDARLRGLIHTAEYAAFDVQRIIERRAAIHDIDESRASPHMLEQVVRLDRAQWLNGREYGNDSAPIGVDHSAARPSCDSPPEP